MATARSKLVAAVEAAERHRSSLAAARADAERALGDLRGAEERTEAASRSLGERVERESAARRELEAARGRTVEARLAEARLAGDVAAIERDRARVAADRSAAERRTEEARRTLAVSMPAEDGAGRDELTGLLGTIADAERRLRELRDAGRAETDQLAAARREREAWTAESERLRRRAAEAEQRLIDARAAAERAAERLGGATALHDQAVAEAEAARRGEETAEQVDDEARAAADRATAAHREQTAAAERAAADLDRTRTALEAVDAELQATHDEAVARSARARRGQRISEGLEVDPVLRVAVEAILEDRLTAFLVDQDAIAPLVSIGGGTFIMREGAPRSRGGDGTRAERAAIDAGGGRLEPAVRRDPTGAVTALLARSLWVPGLADALAIRPLLPAGWSVVTTAGEVISDDGTVRVGGRTSRLDRQAARDELARELDAREQEAARAVDRARASEKELATAQAALDVARWSVAAARTSRRVADDAERTSGRSAESTTREADWARTKLSEAEREAAGLADAIASIGEPPKSPTDGASATADGQERVIADQEARLAALRERRGRLEVAVAGADRIRETERERRRRAEIGLAIDEELVARLDGEASRLVAAASEMGQVRERNSAELAGATAEEARLAGAVDELLRDSGDERTRLLESERAASDARERLRAADARIRAGEVAEMEARLQSDGIREQLLVELAGIGSEGLEALLMATGVVESDGIADVEDVAAALEQALTTAIEVWHHDGADFVDETAPSPARLGTLRRRYHDLGASNPFAAEEYAEVRARLDSLEAQRTDIESAIASTRELIVELSTLISDQFRATFTALEGAFGRRFQQLFDGGEAQLSLTDPDDLSTTGVEINARPPGKKRQPLAMLSGGERALTAVALLMAMLEVRPVPFCVLDEVDAALDEANIERFSAALRSLAETIQFIVITHNRGTIEAADALYGVTIGDDAVSRVVSLRLGDVELDGHEAVAIPVVGGEGSRIAGSPA